MVACNLQSKCRKPSGHMGPLSQVEHSMRQGPEGLHSQNLLQSEGSRSASPCTSAVAAGLTVFVDVVVGGVVVEEVVAVGDQAAVIHFTLLVVDGRFISRLPHLQR